MQSISNKLVITLQNLEQKTERMSVNQARILGGLSLIGALIIGLFESVVGWTLFSTYTLMFVGLVCVGVGTFSLSETTNGRMIVWFEFLVMIGVIVNITTLFYVLLK